LYLVKNTDLGKQENLQFSHQRAKEAAIGGVAILKREELCQSINESQLYSYINIRQNAKAKGSSKQKRLYYH